MDGPSPSLLRSLKIGMRKPLWRITALLAISAVAAFMAFSLGMLPDGKSILGSGTARADHSAEDYLFFSLQQDCDSNFGIKTAGNTNTFTGDIHSNGGFVASGNGTAFG